MEAIGTEPEALGYEFGRWTTARLATYLEEQTGINLSGELRRILQQKKYAYLWAYSLEDKQDPQNRAIFKQKLEGYLQASKVEPDKIQVWFWDESGFSLRVIRRKAWHLKGSRKKVTGKRGIGRVNVMGGLRFHDRKQLCYFYDKGTGESFYAQLEMLYNASQLEWIKLGNEGTDFEQKGTKILVVLDNASYHKKKDIKEEIERNLPNLQLYFLPPYSPDFNLIELVWHSAKEYIAHRLFKSIDELRKLLDELLNQEKLEIKWGRKLKDKGDTAYAI